MHILTSKKERELRIMKRKMVDLLGKKHIEYFCSTLNIGFNQIEDIYVNPGRSANNSNYVIVVNNKSYLYRIPGFGTEKFCSRDRENLAYELLKPFHLTDEVFHLSTSLGIKISKYYENSRIPNSSNKEEIIACMHELNRLHNQKIEFPYTDTLFDRMERYRDYVFEVGGEIHYLQGFDDYLLKIRQFNEQINEIGFKLCFTHGDASINNFLITEEFQNPILIDMEFPAIGDPFGDLATFCVDAEYRKDDVLSILEYYLGREGTLHEKYHILGLCAMAGMMWYSWAVYRVTVEDDNQLFLDFRDAYHQYVGELYDSALEIFQQMSI